MSSSSIFRQKDGAVLVTGPKCAEQDGAVAVEHERCENVDLSERSSKNPIIRFFEANFGDKKPAEMQEMQERASTVNIVSRSGLRESVGGYDICKEYSYSGDDDENNYFNTPASHNPLEELAQGLGEDLDERVLTTHVLGRTYHPIKDYATRRDDESALFWFTYRCDFPEIIPYTITSDAGWGCMLRSAQMLLAQALRIHYKGRDWRPTSVLSRRRQDPFVRSILTWFADFPSSTENLYSIHNMVATGLAKYDKLPGEWYGPGTACYVLRDLVDMHERRQVEGKAQLDRRMFRVHVSPESAVYRDAIEALMTRDGKKAKATDPSQEPAHPLDLGWEEDLVESSSQAEWDTALLLLIPLRLGLKALNEEYVGAVAHTFSFPQSVGVLGGRPRGARWFYGALSDGSRIFGLDPHTVQNAPRKRVAQVNGKSAAVVELSDDYLRSVHTTYPEVFSLQKMDPSIALGFYCKSRDDLMDIISRLRMYKEDFPSSPELFTVADVAPDYGANVSTAMEDMAGSLLDAEVDQLSDEEDDYVML